VPFRQSKLTYLLTDALSGNSRTLMVAAVSPAQSEADETLGTLRFASSVKKVRTLAVANEQDMRQCDRVLQTMKCEVVELRAAAQQMGLERPQALQLQQDAEAVEQAVKTMQTRIDPKMWQEARAAEAEVGRQRAEALAGLGVPLAIGGMMCGGEEEGVTAGSPYLLNISDEISLAGQLLYFLPEGAPITVGSAENNRIQLAGPGVSDRLCELVVSGGGKRVILRNTGSGGRLAVNGNTLSEGEGRRLSHAARIVFGEALSFRLVVPHAEPLNEFMEAFCATNISVGSALRMSGG